jgi:hypothetical protein
MQHGRVRGMVGYVILRELLQRVHASKHARLAVLQHPRFKTPFYEWTVIRIDGCTQRFRVAAADRGIEFH